MSDAANHRLTILRALSVSLSLLYVLGFIGMLIVHPGSETFYKDFFNSYQALPPLFAGVCGVALARKGEHTSPLSRLGWLCIGLGAFSFAAGQII